MPEPELLNAISGLIENLKIVRLTCAFLAVFETPRRQVLHDRDTSLAFRAHGINYDDKFTRSEINEGKNTKSTPPGLYGGSGGPKTPVA